VAGDHKKHRGGYGEQCGWAGCRAAAGDQVAHGDKMRADAPREGGRDTAMLNVELRVADLNRSMS